MNARRYVLYDYLQVAGGAERFALSFAQAFPEYRLSVSRVFSECSGMAELEGANPLVLGSLFTQWMRRVPEAIWCYKRRTRFLRDADSVLYSGYYAPLGVANQPAGNRFYYCHTPPRYLYDWNGRYRERLPPLLRPAFDVFVAYLRTEYSQALARMDRTAANSANVASRLKRFLGIDAPVIYPPTDTSKFRWRGQDDYYLSLARLTRNKRVEPIIQAFLRMPERTLVVASGGDELPRLRRLAEGAPNIHFTGWQTDAQLFQLIGNAIAVIYLPQDEDFGMSPIEAMAAGKPVIGVAEGGLLETVVHQQTGVLLDPLHLVENLVEAVNSLDKVQALSMRQACQDRAELFSASVFKARMSEFLQCP